MKPNREDLRALVASICGIPPESIGDETRFVQDLAMDSISSLDLLTELEEVHGIVITQNEARHVQTFGKLVEYVAALP